MCRDCHPSSLVLGGRGSPSPAKAIVRYTSLRMCVWKSLARWIVEICTFPSPSAPSSTWEAPRKQDWKSRLPKSSLWQLRHRRWRQPLCGGLTGATLSEHILARRPPRLPGRSGQPTFPTSLVQTPHPQRNCRDHWADTIILYIYTSTYIYNYMHTLYIHKYKYIYASTRLYNIYIYTYIYTYTYIHINSHVYI